MAEADGAKIIPGPGARTLSLRDEEILIDRARGVSAGELAKKHGVSVQRIYNLTNENRARFQQIRRAESETLQVLKQETFADQWIMQEAPRMAGYGEIARGALRKFMELMAATYIYDESGQVVSSRMTRHDVANMKTLGELYDRMVRSAVELSGQMPGRLGDRFAMAVIGRHRDPKTPEELAAEQAEQERATAEREAKVEARMRRQFPFLFPQPVDAAGLDAAFEAEYDAAHAEFAAVRGALAPEEEVELAQLKALYPELLNGRDLARLEHLRARNGELCDDEAELLAPAPVPVMEDDPNIDIEVDV